jgi:hypothetical protein
MESSKKNGQFKKNGTKNVLWMSRLFPLEEKYIKEPMCHIESRD